MNVRAWLIEKIGSMERLKLSERGEGALSAFRECLEQVDARSPTDEEIDEVIDTALREGTPRHRVRRHLRALFGEGPIKQLLELACTRSGRWLLLCDAVRQTQGSGIVTGPVADALAFIGKMTSFKLKEHIIVVMPPRPSGEKPARLFVRPRVHIDSPLRERFLES